MIEIALASGAGGLVGMFFGFSMAQKRIEKQKDEIPETLDCPGCSRRIERGAFCRHCGEYLSWDDQEPEPVEAVENEDESMSLVERVASLIPVEIEIEDGEDDEIEDETETDEIETEPSKETVENPPTTDGGERDETEQEDEFEELLGEDGAEQVEELLDAVEDTDDETETTETESLGDEISDETETREYVEFDDSDIDDGRTVYRSESG